MEMFATMDSSYQQNLCGCFYLSSAARPDRRYLPQVDLSSHTMILSTISRTRLTQTFLNPSKSEMLEQVQYVFPLYDGVTVVGFKCTVAGRVIVGVVKEKQQARKDYKEAVDRGETAGLLEQFSSAADCFSTRIGNVPPNDKVIVEIIYLGELKHDAETDGVRFTIPTLIAPRYGSATLGLGDLPRDASSATDKEGIRILVDIAVEDGVTIRGVQSPTHPIAMMMGRISSMPEEAFDNQHASATLTLGRAELDKDFVIVVTSKGHDAPRALLETHPTIPNHRAVMATLVPKFSLPPIRPEIVFIADRSGSMQGKIPLLVSALKIFLKSLPVGTKFNICSFGSRHEFLWPRSKSYNESSLITAQDYVDSFDSNFGATEMLPPVQDAIKNRYNDMHLEVIVVTDGEIWNQRALFRFINNATTNSVRFFSLGIGHGASSSLVEGIARAGDGFAQFAGENEKMEKRVVRMLKGALSPHIKDYTMEVKYEEADEEYEIVGSVTESLRSLDTSPKKPESTMKKKVISLFDSSAKVDDDDDDEDTAAKDDHLPLINTPKLLQAPHRIPSLHPFNRSTVYLLISPESCQRTPRAIVLHATSDHGPLKLEVPIQDIGTGEMIHQLGVRKAIQELEEGRGWITEAKDGDGTLLKTKYEGKWDELVEREAVRLGTQFQVGSRWCSFVAVDEDANHNTAEDLGGYGMTKYGAGRETGNNPFPSFGFSAQPEYKASHLKKSAVGKTSFGSVGGLFGGTQSAVSNSYSEPLASNTGYRAQPLHGRLPDVPSSPGSGSPWGTIPSSPQPLFGRSIGGNPFASGSLASSGLFGASFPAPSSTVTQVNLGSSGVFGDVNPVSPNTQSGGLFGRTGTAARDPPVPRAGAGSPGPSHRDDVPQSSHHTQDLQGGGFGFFGGMVLAAPAVPTSTNHPFTPLIHLPSERQGQENADANETISTDPLASSVSFVPYASVAPSAQVNQTSYSSSDEDCGFGLFDGDGPSEPKDNDAAQVQAPPGTQAMWGRPSTVSASSERQMNADQDLVDHSDDEEMMGFGIESTVHVSSAPDVKAAPMPKTDEEKMHELIALQSFDGSWKWGEGLFQMLEIEQKKLRAVLTGLQEEVMATLVAVAFLEGRVAAEEGVWEMVVEKAKGWLAAKVGESRYVDDLARVKKDVLGLA